MPQPVNGHGAVDLDALKHRSDQRKALEEQREQLTNQVLMQAGLLCPCGERIRDQVVIYFIVVDEPVPTPHGPQLGVNLRGFQLHSRECPQAVLLEEQAIARRDGVGGPVTWLDERRAARASREQ